MTNDSKSPATVNYFLEPGFILVTAKPTVISAVLGSCVSVCIFDRKRKIGGMNHFRLPYIDDLGKTTSLYGNVATLTLIRLMLEEDSKLKHLEAQIYGGAYNPEISTHDIGSENITVARQILERQKVSVASEDVGGRKGRKIIFNTNSNEIGVIKVDKLRREDWYPYDSDR